MLSLFVVVSFDKFHIGAEPNFFYDISGYTLPGGQSGEPFPGGNLATHPGGKSGDPSQGVIWRSFPGDNPAGVPYALRGSLRSWSRRQLDYIITLPGGRSGEPFPGGNLATLLRECALEQWNRVNVGPWNRGSIDPWNRETVEPWKEPWIRGNV